MKRMYALLLFLTLFGACKENKPVGPPVRPTPTTVPTPVPKSLKLIKAQAPSGVLLDYKTHKDFGYLLRKDGRQLLLSVFDGVSFSTEELVTTNCDSNSMDFLLPRLVVTDDAIYVGWGKLREKGIRVLFRAKDKSTSWAPIPAGKLLNQYETEQLELLHTPKGKAIVAAVWINGPASGVVISDMEGQELSNSKYKSKSLFSFKTDNKVYLLSRFKDTYLTEVLDNGSTNLQVYKTYFVKPVGLVSERGTFLAGWTKDVEAPGPNGKPIFWPQVLSVVTPSGLVDLVTLQKPDGLKASTTSGIVEIGGKIFVLYSTNGKVYTVDLEQNKQEIGNGADLLVQRVNYNRFDIVTSGAVFSYQFR